MSAPNSTAAAEIEAKVAFSEFLEMRAGSFCRDTRFALKTRIRHGFCRRQYFLRMLIFNSWGMLQRSASPSPS